MVMQMLLAGLVSVASLTAFGQGKVDFVNDGASLITMSTSIWDWLDPGDAGRLGTAVGNSSPLHSVTLVAGLYGGTSSSQLFLYSTVALNDPGLPAGVILPTHIVLNANPATGAPAIPGIANNTPIGPATPWFQVKVWDSRFPNYEMAVASAGRPPTYIGEGAEFQLNPALGLTYNLTAPPGPNSTWNDGPIVVFGVPEPTSFALAGLATGLAIFCRRRFFGARSS